MGILAGLKYRTGYSAHQSRNCGLASVSAATSSANRGSPGCRPAAARNWLSRTRAARSQVVKRARFSASVNIIHSRLRRSTDEPGRIVADPPVGLVPHQVVEVDVVDRRGVRGDGIDQPLQPGRHAVITGRVRRDGRGQAGQVPEVAVLVRAQPKRTRQRADDLRRGRYVPALLQPGVPGEAHARELRDLLAAQPGGPAPTGFAVRRQSHVGRAQPGPP